MTAPTERHAACPEAEFHGNPFRFCPVKGCGWMEPDNEPDAPTMSEPTPEAVVFTVKTLRDRAKYHQTVANEHLGTATQTVGVIHQLMSEDYARLADALS